MKDNRSTSRKNRQALGVRVHADALDRSVTLYVGAVRAGAWVLLLLILAQALAGKARHVRRHTNHQITARHDRHTARGE